MLHQSPGTEAPLQPTHPRCANCDVPMWLIRVKQTGPAEVYRTFECKACDATILQTAHVDAEKNP